MPHVWSLRLALWGLLALFCLPAPATGRGAATTAAPQGITVVSDTSDAAAPDTMAAAPAAGPAAPDDWGDDWGHSLFKMFDWLNVAGWVLSVLLLLFVLSPLLLLALLAWWLLWGRHRSARRAQVGTPQPPVRRNRVVRNAALGAGLTLMCLVLEWRAGVALGLLVLCVAAGDGLIWWLDNRRSS